MGSFQPGVGAVLRPADAEVPMLADPGHIGVRAGSAKPSRERPGPAQPSAPGSDPCQVAAGGGAGSGVTSSTPTAEGKGWQQARVPVSSDLDTVVFPRPEQGLGGGDGVVLHSQDGGTSWQKQLDGRQIPRNWSCVITRRWPVPEADAVAAMGGGPSAWWEEPTSRCSTSGSG